MALIADQAENVPSASAKRDSDVSDQLSWRRRGGVVVTAVVRRTENTRHAS